MKLSEAIRLGAMLKPQGFGGTTKDASCALRAASDALGIPELRHLLYYGLNYEELKGRFPFLRCEAHCPACSARNDDTLSIIWHLNDTHRWTREQIADWVATVEPQSAKRDQEINSGEQSEPALATVPSRSSAHELI